MIEIERYFLLTLKCLQWQFKFTIQVISVAAKIFIYFGHIMQVDAQTSSYVHVSDIYTIIL